MKIDEGIIFENDHSGTWSIDFLAMHVEWREILIDPVTVSHNVNIDFSVCVRGILRGNMTQKLLIKRVYGGQHDTQKWFTSNRRIDFYVDGINKWGEQSGKYSMRYAVRGTKE